MPEKELERILVELAGAGQTITSEQLQTMIDSVGNGINYVTKEVVTENGNATTIYQLVNPATLATAPLALLTMEIPTALAFIGPTLGIAVGAGVLSQTEPFQNVGNMIGEKIYAFLNEDGLIYFPEETIQAYTKVLYDEGYLEKSFVSDTSLYDTLQFPPEPAFSTEFLINQPTPGFCKGTFSSINHTYETDSGVIIGNAILTLGEGSEGREYDENGNLVNTDTTSPLSVTWNGQAYRIDYLSTGTFSQLSGPIVGTKTLNISALQALAFYILYGARFINELLQPDAVVPETIPLNIPTTYPSWTPSTAPGVVPAPNIYPIEIPAAQPVPEVEPTPQPQIQSPSPITNPETDPRSAPTTEIITQTQPQVYPNPVPQPSPDPDPAPSVNPDPSLDPSQPVEPNPPSANTDPDPTTPTIVDPSLISGSAGKLFTVYNPSSTGLNDLGAYLWSTNIIDIVKSIWQNPMDGIISYFVLYATPEANRTSTIYLGALDSGVSSPVVTNQFIDIDCGEVQIKEKWNNIGDYPPYTSIKLFLPFVGFVDINPDDVMGRDDGGGYIKVTYRVDVYTGTCLAQVWVKRAADMANYQILYTYNGNCAQQIPLTGATYQGLMQTLVGASVGFASAGLTGALASAATQFAGHQQVQMQRSGNMSANAGVLGQRKPYLIISRNNVYYATNFAEYYGYPAHATVVLGNMSGYVRVRDIHLEVPATSEELDEIEDLLKEGVWF